MSEPLRASVVSQLGPKAISCLEMARLLHRPISDHEAYEAAYADACRLYSEKAVLAKFRELVDRGYLECGVSARTAWLTEKGRHVLENKA